MILWPSRIRRRFDILDIQKIEKYLLENGYELQFEGGLTKDENSDDSWFKYLHYYNKDKQFKIRICYFGNKSNIKEICTWDVAKKQQWCDFHYPDYRMTLWKNFRKNICK